MRNYSRIFIVGLVFFLNACGSQTVDLNELETFFRGRDLLFDNDYGNTCQYTLKKTDIGLEIQHRIFPEYIERYSFSDFEIIEKYALGQEGKYFEVGDWRVIGHANITYMQKFSSTCYESFY